MARYRLLITLAIVSLAFAAYGDQPVFAPRDPSAARKDFSNVDPSTAIDALNLGTMATEAKTDYVATDTFTAHVADNSDIHGCTAIASASAVADALSAANASDALNLRLDGSRAMTGNLRLGGKWLSNDGGNEGLQVSDGGNVLINTTSDDGANKLQVNGGMYCVSSFIQPSGGSDGTTGIKTGVVSLTVNATTTLSLADGMYPGMIMFYEGNNGKSSIYYFDRQDAQTIEQMDVSGRYSPTKDNASTINLYFYSSVLTLQNKTASTVKIRYSIFGLIP